MTAEVAEARAPGETGWVESTRRGFDEMSGAAQRHEWEQLAVAPAGEGALPSGGRGDAAAAAQ
eukprot:6467508-Prymnesium_polylepis.1